ncbi:hypothetical protein COCVIDRAFT_94164 [Bipolaris victoriae FI3]|uniref:Uncharacterized protein n=2 Tax=Bipolaris TaxID=33194 RepID=W6Z103_COCC2|nr:uncharacterized protein COCCADRAFT_85793 [Bipolaris zeicola 26-R-13]XP_014558542.1 hypothetical protein COCVIDRAFT_94164 [Bipolaris victoriae FI3]EUC37351.1 hypothetical protein COCCADRAFT_85793 [Bipolaris zeicola 26-R-13]
MDGLCCPLPIATDPRARTRSRPPAPRCMPPSNPRSPISLKTDVENVRLSWLLHSTKPLLPLLLPKDLHSHAADPGETPIGSLVAHGQMVRILPALPI